MWNRIGIQVFTPLIKQQMRHTVQARLHTIATCRLKLRGRTGLDG
jgi:hypothetical protein